MPFCRRHLSSVGLPFSLVCFAATVLAAPGDVLRSFPSPARYPTGLACDGTAFYVADWRDGRIHRLAVADGRVLESFEAPTLRPAGLAWGAGKLFVSDDRTGWVYVLDAQTRVTERAFEAPGPSAAGLAWSPAGLYVLEQKSEKIYRVVPEDGTILGFCSAPTKSAAHLAYDGQYLCVSDRTKNELYLVEPEHGQVLGILPAPGPYAAGLAWHDGTLWNVDFQTRQVYQLRMDDVIKYRLSEPREARVEFLWALYNYGPGEVHDVTVSFALPPLLPSQELLSELEFSAPPARFETDQWGQRCAVFTRDRLAAGARSMLGYRVAARVSALRFFIRPEQTGTLDDIPPDVRKPYTADGARYRIDTPYIRNVVQQVVGDERNCYWIARRVYNHVIDRIEYEMIGGWDIPEVVLKRGKGSCSEYTFTFIALCRAAGLPARYQGSVVVRGDDASIDDAFHRWAEVYLPHCGWVPVDANKGDAKWPADQARGFGELANRFLITTQGGGGSEYLDWSYNHFGRWQATGYCKVEEETYAFWEPLAPPVGPAAGEGSPTGGVKCQP
jgi:transglutaminase-like putative cysteine protease/outer membrane protein assembly factor BamB